MILIEKVNENNNCTTCNACHEFNDDMFELFFTINSRYGTKVMICKDCLEELQSKINEVIQNGKINTIQCNLLRNKR